MEIIIGDIMTEEKFRKCKKCHCTNPESKFEKVFKQLSVTQTEEYFKCPVCQATDNIPDEPRYYIDVKETSWRRVILDLGSGDNRISIEKFKQMLDMQGETAIWDYEADSYVEEQKTMTVTENGGNATLELYPDDGHRNDPIWSNKKNSVSSGSFSNFISTNDEIL